MDQDDLLSNSDDELSRLESFEGESNCATVEASSDVTNGGNKSDVVNGTHQGQGCQKASMTREIKARISQGTNAINVMPAIEFKLLMFLLVALLSLVLFESPTARAGFFTFYFPNALKPKGFSELTDMIGSLENQINETRDTFSDMQYFWGQLEFLDSTPSEYPEESACAEVFPLFRDLAIEYTYIDYEHYIKPAELYRDHLLDFRDEWYPMGLESRAALPRKWEQDLLKTELDLKIQWLSSLIDNEEYRAKRKRMTQTWTAVRRSLDTSLPCIYLRYAYRQIAEDINEVALKANLDGMIRAKTLLERAYDRIKKYAAQDEKIIKDVADEQKKFERFKIES